VDIPAKRRGIPARPFLALMSHAIRWYGKRFAALITALFLLRINA
jgi:hypothetical protein